MLVLAAKAALVKTIDCPVGGIALGAADAGGGDASVGLLFCEHAAKTSKREKRAARFMELVFPALGALNLLGVLLECRLEVLLHERDRELASRPLDQTPSDVRRPAQAARDRVGI